MTLLILDKLDFSSNNITRNQEGHFIVVKASIIKKISQF